MRQSNLVQQIRDTVQNGKAKEPFKSSDFHFMGNKMMADVFPNLDEARQVIMLQQISRR
jgi:hypothetical protein